MLLVYQFGFPERTVVLAGFPSEIPAFTEWVCGYLPYNLGKSSRVVPVFDIITRNQWPQLPIFLGGDIWSNAIKRLCFDDNTTRNVVDDNTTREYKSRRNISLPCHVVRIPCNCKSSFSSSWCCCGSWCCSLCGDYGCLFFG